MCLRFLKMSLIAMLLLLAGCGEKPGGVAFGGLKQANRQSDLHAGTLTRPAGSPLDGDEEAIAEGKRLYSEFNCAGCHAAGGGAIGPALMDDDWIYGSTSANIYWTVVEGRPNGMPAFGERITDKQLWQLAAFVRSLSDLPKKAPEK